MTFVEISFSIETDNYRSLIGKRSRELLPALNVFTTDSYNHIQILYFNELRYKIESLSQRLK